MTNISVGEALQKTMQANKRYVDENRTHWVENYRKVLFDEELMASYYPIDYLYNTDIKIEEGQKYYITYDGTTYECISFIADGKGMIGNFYFYDFIIHDTEDNGIPFLIVDDGESVFCYLDRRDVYIHVKIEIDAQIVHKIDKKYLPDEFFIATNDLNSSIKESYGMSLEKYTINFYYEDDFIKSMTNPATEIFEGETYTNSFVFNDNFDLSSIYIKIYMDEKEIIYEPCSTSVTIPAVYGNVLIEFTGAPK